MMNYNQLTCKKFFKEVCKLLKDFVRRDFIKNNILEQPKKLKKSIRKMNTGGLVMNCLLSALSYLTLAGNYAISHGFIILGISLYLIFNARSILTTIYNQWNVNLSTEIKFSQEDFLTLVGSKILSKTSWNVYQKEDNKWKQSTNEEITNCIANYLSNYWEIENKYWYDIIQIISTFAMLVITIVTNTTIPQYLFIPLLLFSSFFTLLCATIERIQYSNFKTQDRKISNKKSILKNDILRIVPIIPKDQDTRLNRYTNLCKEHYSQKKDLISKSFFIDIISNTVHIASSSILILIYVFSRKEINLSTIAEMTATLTVFNTSINSVERILQVILTRSKNWDVLANEIPMMENILKVYSLETETEPQSIDSLNISPFESCYNETSENDKSFKLILNQNLSFKKGDCISLTGASGSGKSTFLKITTNRIQFHEIIQSKLVPVNYVFYDETIDFGSMSLWDEIFCLDTKTRIEPTSEELEKMEYILKNMKLFQEISEQCKDFWIWMKENNSKNLSKGQKQRLIVSKILFWLSPDIDIVALDECTSGLDTEANDDENADALKILQFIIQYCNKDKKRILFLATHQNIESLCNHRLHFKRKAGKTIIEKIR